MPTQELGQLVTNAGHVIRHEALRATWAPAESICRSIPNFYTVDTYPVRSPLMVADFLAPKVKGKQFCEIGTRNGDIMSCLSHFAANVTAIEMDPPYCKKLVSRGFRNICKPVEEASDAELAHCDVYFWWPMDPRSQNEVWLKQLLAQHRRSGKGAEVYVAHDTHWKFDMKTLPNLVTKYGGQITRLFFDEGGEVRGHTSYSSPFFDRPGHWGVTHMAKFGVGPLADVPPRGKRRGSGGRRGAILLRSGRGRGRGRGRGAVP